MSGYPVDTTLINISIWSITLCLKVMATHHTLTQTNVKVVAVPRPFLRVITHKWALWPHVHFPATIWVKTGDTWGNQGFYGQVTFDPGHCFMVYSMINYVKSI